MSITRAFALVPLAAYWVILGVLTHLPARQVPQTGIGDKVAHAAAFFMLAAMLYLSVWVVWPLARGIWWKVLVIVLLYGAIDEWTQPLVQRTCDVWDWASDAAGAVSAVAILKVVRVLVQRPHEQRQWQAALERAIDYAQRREQSRQLRHPPVTDAGHR